MTPIKVVGIENRLGEDPQGQSVKLQALVSEKNVPCTLNEH